MTICDLVVLSSRKEVLFRTSYQIIEYSKIGDGTSNKIYRSLDILFEQKPDSTLLSWPDHLRHVKIQYGEAKCELKCVTAENFSSSSAFQFLIKCLQTMHAARDSPERTVKLIIPIVEGQIVRSDIIPLRFIDCDFVESVCSFAEAHQMYTGKSLEADRSGDLVNLFNLATAGLLLGKAPLEVTDCRNLQAILSDSVEQEMENRLSFPWILPQPAPRKRLVLVEADSTCETHGTNVPAIFVAARALGVDLVVLDKPGHWMENVDAARWREAFIPMNFVDRPDPQLSDRVVACVLAYGKNIDGIVAFRDAFAPEIAKAAERLGLPFEKPEAYETIIDKFKTGIAAGHRTCCASTAEEAYEVVRTERLAFPLIIKPCHGWASEGVSRIEALSDIPTAVNFPKAWHREGKFVIEEYCDGPEVDVNMVIENGEILFYEISDGLPKSADTVTHADLGTSWKSFIEVDNVYPSALPSGELELLRTKFHQILLQLGFKNGVFHIEGRMERSSMEYRLENGAFDLACKEPTSPGSQVPWLIEINPRPPGDRLCDIIESTYGIDYWGIAVLIALSDSTRARALSFPFKSGPQHCSVLWCIPVDYSLSSCNGVLNSEDVCKNLLSRRPDLAKNISRCGCFFNKGSKVPHPDEGTNAFLGYFNIFSKKGRREALEIAKIVKAEVRPQYC